MGRRIDNLRFFIQYLRDTEPKYSFEILIFHVVLGVACIGFSFLGEFWLWAITITLLYISLVIHYLRVRRAIKRQINEELAWLEQMRPILEQVLSRYKQIVRADTHRSEPDEATREEMRRLRDEIAQARRDA